MIAIILKTVFTVFIILIGIAIGLAGCNNRDRY